MNGKLISYEQFDGLPIEGHLGGAIRYEFGYRTIKNKSTNKNEQIMKCLTNSPFVTKQLKMGNKPNCLDCDRFVLNDAKQNKSKPKMLGNGHIFYGISYKAVGIDWYVCCNPKRKIKRSMML